MIRRKKASLLRPTLAALIGSSMTASQLKELAMLLEEDSEFNYMLGRALYETSQSLNSKMSFDWDVEEPTEKVSEDSALVELALGVVNRKRMTKRHLYEIARSVYPPGVSGLKEKDTSRQIIAQFFASATTSARQKFLKELGVEITVDPYLGGISRRL